MKSLREFIKEAMNDKKFYFDNTNTLLIDTYEKDDFYDGDDFDEDGYQMMIDEFWEEVEEANKEHNNGFLVTGDLELWHGKKEIIPEYFYELKEAFDKCLGRSTEDMIVHFKGGRLLFQGLHHDGRNQLWISALSDYGLENWEAYDDGDDEDMSWVEDIKSYEPIKWPSL